MYGIFTVYLPTFYHHFTIKFKPNVGKYTSPMDLYGRRMRQEIGAGTVLPAGGVSGWQKQREQRVVKRDMSWLYLDDYEIYYTRKFHYNVEKWSVKGGSQNKVSSNPTSDEWKGVVDKEGPTCWGADFLTMWFFIHFETSNSHQLYSYDLDNLHPIHIYHIYKKNPVHHPQCMFNA